MRQYLVIQRVRINKLQDIEYYLRKSNIDTFVKFKYEYNGTVYATNTIIDNKESIKKNML